MSEGLIDHLKAILSKKTFEKREILLHEGGAAIFGLSSS
jgi:hypothetical protein